MHTASQGLTLDAGQRPAWDDEIWDVVPREDPDLWHRYSEVKKSAADHPAGGTDLLIHQDAHLGNIHVTSEGRFTVFDFDDCGYGTATHDVAIVLFYWTMGFPGDLAKECRRFFSLFLAGYERQARLPSDWQEGVDLFLKLREADIYALLKDELVGLADEEPDEPWDMEMRFFDGRRERILEGAPFLGRPLREILR